MTNRDKRNANECLFNTSDLFWNVADPVKPLTSYSAQIKFDITIWNGSYSAMHWPIHLVSGVKRKRKNWILYQYKLFGKHHYHFSEKLTWFMGFLFSGRTVYRSREILAEKTSNCRFFTIIFIVHIIIILTFYEPCSFSFHIHFFLQGCWQCRCIWCYSGQPLCSI